MLDGQSQRDGLNLIIKEEKDQGEIGLSVYSQYLSQSPGCCCNLGVLLFAAAPFALILWLRYYISDWTALPLSLQSHSNRAVQFVVLSLIAFGLSGLASFLIGVIFINLSNKLHNSMLKRVAHAPITFFYSNPLGRIINRFSKDTAMADSVVTYQAFQFLQVSAV